MHNYYFICFVVIMALMGLCIGSFLNVVIYRLPRGMNLAYPPSHCTSCDHELKWYDNIPVFSYIFLKGKCRYCGAKITPRYLIVEVVNTLLWVLACVLFYDEGIAYCIIYCLAVSVILSSALIDAENMFIPEAMFIALFVLGVALIGFDLGYKKDFADRLFGLLLGGGSFLVFYLLSILIYKREGMGFGDVQIMAGGGMLLGFWKTFFSIIVSVVFCLIVIVIRKCISKKKSKKNVGLELGVEKDEKQELTKEIEKEYDGKAFPFAPFLAFGILVALYVGKYVVEWYLTLLA